MNTTGRRILCTALALTAVMSLYGGSISAAPVTDDTGAVTVRIRADKPTAIISPYIYGINDKGDISGATVLKQYGAVLSSYNWESNYSNDGAHGKNENGIELIENFNEDDWDTPALYTDNLITNAFRYNIPVRLVNLQMMGYVSADALGVVNRSIDRSERWDVVSFSKDDSYLTFPDTEDGIVYIDEYAAYLMNKYGTAAEGGIDGYFLDSEPDKWDENFPVLELGPLEPSQFSRNSAKLSEAVKQLDSSAMIFGPSLSGVGACVDLNGSFFSDNGFAGYYLRNMRESGEAAGVRLLDVFDTHFYTSATDRSGNSILNTSGSSADTYRLQAPRELWDETYIEDSDLYSAYGEYMPFIPYLKNVIDENYPGTKFSFSEYSFGGGDNISGCIAETDALGIFAENGVYLACLMPDDDSSFQCAALSLFRNYDGNGSRFGNELLYSDNGGDSMSSCYAAQHNGDNSEITLILTNKNARDNKQFTIELDSSTRYETAEEYTITGDSPKIRRIADTLTAEGNSFSLTMPPRTVSLLVIHGRKTKSTDSSGSESDISSGDTETTSRSGTESETISNAADLTIEIETEPATQTTAAVTETEPVTVTVPETTVTLPPETEPVTALTAKQPTIFDKDSGKVLPAPLKIVISILIIWCFGMMAVIIFIKK
ncbi:MAG: hypothetical protein II773_04790 [Oscillospiraceae bacterium]|nr:hypothetical protein [Oscillospiraceae bacterium]